MIPIKRSDNRKSYDNKTFLFDLEKDKLTYYSKRYGWSYENECRLVIEVNKNLIKDYDNDTEYYITIKPNDKSLEILHNPNYNGQLINISGIKTNYSSYKDKINWKL